MSMNRVRDLPDRLESERDGYHARRAERGLTPLWVGPLQSRLGATALLAVRNRGLKGGIGVLHGTGADWRHGCCYVSTQAERLVGYLLTSAQ